MYSKELMKRFQNPKNHGEINNPDGLGKVGNPVCGDIMWVYIKVRDDKISDIKFKTLGCAAAIATSDVLCDLAKGKKLADALAITKEDIVKELVTVPEVKVHCSILAIDGLKEAVKDYRKKK